MAVPFAQAKDNFRSTVIGHFHSQAGAKWWANPEFRVFGMSVGCGIDVSRLQFEYGRTSILTKFLLRDFHEFFEERGYAVGKIFPNYVDFRPYSIDHEDFIGPNFLAVRRERRDWIDLLQ